MALTMRLFPKVDGTLNHEDRPAFFNYPFTLRFPSPPEPVELAAAVLPPVYTRPQRLALLARTSPNGPVLADLTEAQGVIFASNEHGFADLRGFMPMTLYAAFAFYHQEDPIHIEATDGCETIYEGRLEDVQINRMGLGFAAFGYWRALSDLLVTAAFSDTDLSNWYVLNDVEVAEAKPDKFTTDKYNRLYMAPKTDQTYSDATAYCSFGYRIPDMALRQLEAIRFSYRFDMPSPWRVELARCAADWSELEVVWSLDGDGSLQQATDHEETFDPCPALRFTLYYNDTAAAYTGEDGDAYLALTHLRVKSSAAEPLTFGTIAGYLVEEVSSRNPSQLSSDTSDIGDPGVDLEDAYFEDARPSDILTALTALGDNQNPPRPWVAAVWEGRRLTVQPKGFNAAYWEVDAVDLEVERSLDDVVNTAYATYNDPARGRKRTAEETTATGGVIRVGYLEARTSSQTLAEKFRDTFLADNAEARPRATIKAIGVFDRRGVEQPLYKVRAGDYITIRNLPPDLDELDNIRTFRIVRVEYDAENDLLTPVPETPTPTLAILVARHEKGL